MSPKTLLASSIVLVFLAGIGLGFVIHDSFGGAKKLVPQNNREQAFFAQWKNERVSIVSPAENLRVGTNNGSLTYVHGVSSAAQIVTRGGTAASVTRIVSESSQAMSAPMSEALGKQGAVTYMKLWQDMASLMVSYAQAKATNSADGTAGIVTSIDTQAGSIATFYHSVSDAVAVNAVQPALQQTMKSMRDAIDASVSGRLPDVTTAENAAAKKLSSVMDTVASALVHQNPGRY